MGSRIRHKRIQTKIFHPILYVALRRETTVNKKKSLPVFVVSADTTFGTLHIHYVGQTGRSVGVRHEEHTRYIKTNNQGSTYALHVLNNRQEYGNAKQPTEPLKSCNKGIKMYWWESFFIHVLQQQDVLIDEQRVNDLNPLYALAHVTRRYTT